MTGWTLNGGEHLEPAKEEIMTIQIGRRIVSQPSAERSPSADPEVVVVEITTAGNAVDPDQSQLAADRSGGEPRRFRRRFERFKGSAENDGLTGSFDDEDDLRLQLMLLREENARLKAARHKPPDTGSMIDRVRMLAEPSGNDELLDESWSLLVECQALREGLDQACVEIQAAIGSVRARLAALGLEIEPLMPDDRAEDRRDDRSSLSA